MENIANVDQHFVPIDEIRQTCLEELDSYTKINDLVQKSPKLDSDWLPEKHVS